MPALVAASRSMLSTPTPARPITRSLLAPRSMSAFTSTAERTIRASASDRAVANPFVSWSGVSTVQPGSCWRSWTALAAIFSAMMICITSLLRPDVGGYLPRRDRVLRRLGINLLRRTQARAQFDGTANLEQNLLQRADRSDSIEIIVITKMGDAEELTFHF